MKNISQKLGIWPNDEILLVNPDERVVERIQQEQHEDVKFLYDKPSHPVPVVLIWLLEGDDATALANIYRQVIDETGQIWFFFPKKETMRKNQLTVTRETVTLDVTRANLEMTKVCSIDADTQAMGFVLRLD